MGGATYWGITVAERGEIGVAVLAGMQGDGTYVAGPQGEAANGAA